MMYGYAYPGPYYGLLGLIVFVLDIVAIINVLGGNSTASRKLLWTFLILVLPVLGMLLYFFIGRSPRDATVM